MSLLKKIPAVVFATGVVGAIPVRADQPPDLQAQIEELRAEVKALKSQQAGNAHAVPANAIVVTAAPAPAPSGRNAGAALPPIQNVASFNAAGNTFTFYGNIDQYLNHMSASRQTGNNPGKVEGLADSGLMTSRLGLIFVRDLDNGYAAKVQVEQSLNFDTGSNTDVSTATSSGSTTAGRLFNRQAYGALITPIGEFRVGRQNSIVQQRGDYIDFTERTLGSVVNDFGYLARYDGDISYYTPRINGLMGTVHYAVGAGNQSAATSVNNGGILQLGGDYVRGPWRIGYAGVMARTTTGSSNVYYHDVYVNMDFGKGTVYFNYAHSNDGYGKMLSVSGGSTVGGTTTSLTVGGQTNPLYTASYQIYQLSADYRVIPPLRVGGLIGWIRNSANTDYSATGASLGLYWSAFNNVTVYGITQVLNNNALAEFEFSGASGIAKNFSVANIQGKKIEGASLGALFRF